ncbi:WYL domain-containing protein [Brevibacterium sp. S22]|uniref:helix-turn-helix transcriptional regulator n=1 Tax=Brevibacterium sp. S22 TaxID=2483794 RepID=UPI0010931554|nr:WYL domain-containing protein [Brevibacterium sp. S22]TGD26061.1 WYL domain-containing protein [Brevibacterium sp. S22]
MRSETRLLTLLGQFASGRVYTAAELAARFDVTPRTIRRDIAALRELGYIISSLPGLAGGYRAESRTVLPPLQLEAGEALATAVGLALLRGAGLVTESADSATTKLQAMLPPTMRATVADIAGAVSVSEGNVPGVDIGAVIALASAINASTIATFDYRKMQRSDVDVPTAWVDVPAVPADVSTTSTDSPTAFAADPTTRAKGGPTAHPTVRPTARPNASPPSDHTSPSRRVEPVRLVVLGAHWYLFAFDLDRADHRVFRLDRMGRVHATTLSVTPREHPDAEAAVSAAVTTTAYPHTVVLRTTASAQEAKEWFPTRSATITEAADGVHITCGFWDLRWVAATLVGIPAEIEVLHPPELIDSLRDQAARMQAVVEASTPKLLPDGGSATSRCEY